MNAIKAVIFDCFGVFYHDFSRELIGALPADRQDELAQARDAANYGLISREEFISQLSVALGKPAEDLRLRIARGIVRNKDLLDYSQTLRPRYKVGLLSNISKETLGSYFTPAERERYFDDVVASSEVGMIKPHPEIFELACQRLGVDTSESIMIDDSAYNCDGARSVGMRAVVYTTFVQCKRDLERSL